MFSPRTVEVWFPADEAHGQSRLADARQSSRVCSAGRRLKKGVTVEKALAEMKEIAGRLSKQYPESNTGVSVTVTPLLENQVGDYRGVSNLLLGAVGLVLLIACANLANLLAARGAARAQEFAVRAAVGASRWHIIRQLLIESLVLALAGGLLGLCLAAWGRDLLVALSPPGVPRFQNLALNGWVLAFQFGAFVCDQRPLRSLACVAYVARGYSTRSQSWRARQLGFRGGAPLARSARHRGSRPHARSAERGRPGAEKFCQRPGAGTRFRSAAAPFSAGGSARADLFR